MAARESAAQKAEREAAEAAAEEGVFSSPDPVQQAVIDAAQHPDDPTVAQAAEVTPDAREGVQAATIAAAQQSTSPVGAKQQVEQEEGKLKLTGLDSAFVNTKRPHPMGPTVGSHAVIQVYEGDALPDDLADGEEDRLRSLGAFDEHPRTAYARKIDALVAVGLAKRGGLPEGQDGGQDDDGEGGDEESVEGDDDFDADTDHA